MLCISLNRAWRCLALVMLTALIALPAVAHDESKNEDGACPKANTARLLGTWGGLRPRLEEAGVRLEIKDQNEYWGNMEGGLRRGSVYAALTTMTLAIDSKQAFGFEGMCLFASAFQMRGRGPTPNLHGALQPVSNIEATRATRLFELWAEQAIPDTGLSIRLGKGAASGEFMLAEDYGGLFLNSSFGFPASAAIGLPSGGPNYPLSTPFARLKWQRNEHLTILAGIYGGDPAGPGDGDPQLRDHSGTNLRFSNGMLAVGEIQIRPFEGESKYPGVYKIGGWYHNGRFADQAFDRSGLSLFDPLSDGVARKHRGNYAVYGVLEQMIMPATNPVGEAEGQGLGIFAMVSVGPGDRNLVDVSAFGGLHWKGLLHPNGEDRLGIAVAYVGISGRARRMSQDAVYYTGFGQPFRGGETVLEATYDFPVKPGWNIQPSLQHIINPGAAPGERQLRNVTVFGVRNTINF